MRPEANSRRLFGITRSKGKMYEFGLPLEAHIAVPEGRNPEELILLSVGTLGDAAALVCDADDWEHHFDIPLADELRFSASYFDAFLASRFSPNLDPDIALLASATYYLAGRPGSSLVLSRQTISHSMYTSLQILARWLLQADWDSPLPPVQEPYDALAQDLAMLVAQHFHDGFGVSEILTTCNRLRGFVYRNGTSQDLLFADLACAITKKRIRASSWVRLPITTGINLNEWSPIISRDGFPKELWPSQMLLAEAGVFSGISGVIQMPTSSGKTRSIEIIIRSSFISQRSRLAVVIAPFRALCHEITNTLRGAFRNDGIKVNELSDALQLDYFEQTNAIFDDQDDVSKLVLVLTPEKFLYVLRHTPGLVNRVGLVIYDEGHQFDSGSRGVIYELLLTEIKKLLTASAQTILISAVIQNAEPIANWLIGTNARIVSGSDLSPTARSVAFASWAEKLGQLMFYEDRIVLRPDYFVPRVIEQQKLDRIGKESKIRAFPERDSATDVALYVGLRLAERGASAIFCGRKDTASNIVTRTVEIYSRGFNLPPPANYSDPAELHRLRNLYSLHFGESADLTKAAMLGVFCHHGNTPHGIRLSIEHAMQNGKIKFVACTSTLAQGVNLPIRYLIVSGVYQGSHRIKVRDFHNLVGRAGRAGMHTEGLVIFADPTIFDLRVSQKHKWRFKAAVNLLNPKETEPTSSSLLSLVSDMKSPTGFALSLEIADLVELLHEEQRWAAWIQNMLIANPASGFNIQSLQNELRRRRQLISSVESHLMANRGAETFEEFSQSVTQLATNTLAYSLADDAQKVGLRRLFNVLAQYIEGREATPAKQAIYAKTLLGLAAARQIESWTTNNRELLLSAEGNRDILSTIWPVLIDHSEDDFFTQIFPESYPLNLARMWLEGKSYEELFRSSAEEHATKRWGNQRRNLHKDDIVEFCEHTLSFQCSLIIGAIIQFLSDDLTAPSESIGLLQHFQKCIKYGIPDPLSVSCYESGFADRMLAQRLRDALDGDGYTGLSFPLAVVRHRSAVTTVLQEYPSYFESVLNMLVA